MLVWANERAAPESVRALNLFPACAMIVRQSNTNAMVQWFEECHPHLSSSLVGEGYSSLKDQSHSQNLMKNMKGNPGW